MKTKLKILIGLVFLSIIGYSCSPEIGDHVSVYLKDSYGYQYDLPRDYCHTIETESEVDIYCSEGKIILYIVPSSSQMELDQQIQGNLDTDTFYSLGEEKSNAGLNGEYREIKFAKLIDPTSNMLSQNELPYFVAVSSFGPDESFMAKGYLYNIKFRSEFVSMFWVVVKSFEQFEPK